MEHYDGWKSRLVVAVILSSHPSPSKRTKEETTREWRKKRARDATAFKGKWKTFSSSFFSFDAIKGHGSLVSMLHARTHTHCERVFKSNDIISLFHPFFFSHLYTHQKDKSHQREPDGMEFILQKKKWKSTRIFDWPFTQKKVDVIITFFKIEKSLNPIGGYYNWIRTQVSHGPRKASSQPPFLLKYTNGRMGPTDRP